MAEVAIFLNSGPLFNGERLESLEELPEWTECEGEAREAYHRIRETFEKHATLLAGNPSPIETRYYMVGPVLHALGFMHSVFERVELVDGRTARVDHVCFQNSADFVEAEPSRGSIAYFRPALCIVRAVEWGSDFTGTTYTPPKPPPPSEDGEEPVPAPPMPKPLEIGIPPAVELDLLLRTTGKDYGILTNGCDWRLYHRSSSSLLNAFFQADMIAALKSDFEDFKRFYLLFRRAAFHKPDGISCFLDNFLA